MTLIGADELSKKERMKFVLISLPIYIGIISFLFLIFAESNMERTSAGLISVGAAIFFMLSIMTITKVIDGFKIKIGKDGISTDVQAHISATKNIAQQLITSVNSQLVNISNLTRSTKLIEGRDLLPSSKDSDKSLDSLTNFKGNLQDLLKELQEISGKTGVSDKTRSVDRKEMISNKMNDLSANAFSSYANEEYNMALETCEEILKEDPKNEFAQYYKGLTLWKLQKFEDALNWFKKLDEEKPGDNEIIYMIAICYDKLKDHDKEEEQYKRILETDKDYAPAIYNIACNRTLSDRIDEALDLLDRAIKANKDVIEWAKTDTDLDKLRDNARFKEMISDL